MIEKPCEVVKTAVLINSGVAVRLATSKARQLNINNKTEAKQMIPTKTIQLPILNPRIESGASLGYSIMDALSFSVGLMCNERWSN